MSNRTKTLSGSESTRRADAAFIRIDYDRRARPIATYSASACASIP